MTVCNAIIHAIARGEREGEKERERGEGRKDEGKKRTGELAEKATTNGGTAHGKCGAGGEGEMKELRSQVEAWRVGETLSRQKKDNTARSAQYYNRPERKCTIENDR